MTQDIKVGSQWLDKDKRMQGRIVVVFDVDESNVWYHDYIKRNLNYRSRRDRFVKAFQCTLPKSSNAA